MPKHEEMINYFINQTLTSMNMLLAESYSRGWIDGYKGVRGPGIKRCKNNNCTTVYFIPSRPNTAYCSVKCRNYRNVNVYRKNGGSYAKA